MYILLYPLKKCIFCCERTWIQTYIIICSLSHLYGWILEKSVDHDSHVHDHCWWYSHSFLILHINQHIRSTNFPFMAPPMIPPLLLYLVSPFPMHIFVMFFVSFGFVECNQSHASHPCGHSQHTHTHSWLTPHQFEKCLSWLVT